MHKLKINIKLSLSLNHKKKRQDYEDKKKTHGGISLINNQ